MKNILFIVNPISGTGKQKKLIPLIEKYLSSEKYNYEIIYTEYKGFVKTINKNIIHTFDIVVAVGGDGTVNEVAQILIDTDISMGVIPIGSGNGLARHLKIPLQIVSAIEKINESKTLSIDTAIMNDETFVNVAGIGFDAHIAHLFANSSKRGNFPYFKLTTLEFYKYKPKKYQMIIDGKSYDLSAFLISIANSSQFGNNAYISPKSIIDDGYLEVCILRKFPIIQSSLLAIQLFNKSIHKSKYMKTIRGKEIFIQSEEDIEAHIDGEPINFGKELHININPSSLNIIC